MQSHYISHNRSTLHYLKFGHGANLLFCFHGYGRESDTFAFLQPLGRQFTIIAIDVPFHGRTDWQDELIFDPGHLKNFLFQIRDSLQMHDKKFHLLGFSMGGRIALHLLQIMPGHVERLLLLAPDGLHFNFWRWFGSNTWLGNTILSYFIHKPGRALWLLDKIVQWGIVSKNMAGFIRYYLQHDEHRIRLYNRYIAMRRFNPSIAKVKHLIIEYKIPVRLLFGSFDNVIPIKGGKNFVKNIESHASLKVINSGHNLLQSWQLPAIADMLLR